MENFLLVITLCLIITMVHSANISSSYSKVSSTAAIQNFTNNSTSTEALNQTQEAKVVMQTGRKHHKDPGVFYLYKSADMFKSFLSSLIMFINPIIDVKNLALNTIIATVSVVKFLIDLKAMFPKHPPHNHHQVVETWPLPPPAYKEDPHKRFDDKTKSNMNVDLFKPYYEQNQDFSQSKYHNTDIVSSYVPPSGLSSYEDKFPENPMTFKYSSKYSIPKSQPDKLRNSYLSHPSSQENMSYTNYVRRSDDFDDGQFNDEWTSQTDSNSGSSTS